MQDLAGLGIIERVGGFGLKECQALEHALRERLVDLDLVEREDGEVVDRGVSGAEIVEGERDAEVLQLPDRRQMSSLVFEQRRLRDLKFQPIRRKSALDQRTQYDVEQIALLELNRG